MNWKSLLIFGLVSAILGAVICYSVMPEPEVPEPEIIVEINTVIDTLRDTTWIPSEKVPAPEPIAVDTISKESIKSTFKGESHGVQVTTDIFAPCNIDSVVFLFKHPLEIRERQRMVVTVDSIKTFTVFVKPPWYKTWLVGFVEGVVLVAGSVYLAGKLK